MELMMTTAVKNPSLLDFFGGNVPSFIFEDDQCFVIEEQNNKQAPVHFLVVPKKPIPKLVDASVDDEKVLGHLLLIARKIAKEKGIDETGFRVVMNEGDHSCQTINQFFVQVLGHILLVAKQVTIDLGIDRTGYHVMVDENYQDKTLKAVHVFSRALHHMVWPMGPGCRL